MLSSLVVLLADVGHLLWFFFLSFLVCFFVSFFDFSCVGNYFYQQDWGLEEVEEDFQEVEKDFRWNEQMQEIFGDYFQKRGRIPQVISEFVMSGCFLFLLQTSHCREALMTAKTIISERNSPTKTIPMLQKGIAGGEKVLPFFTFLTSYSFSIQFLVHIQGHLLQILS